MPGRTVSETVLGMEQKDLLFFLTMTNLYRAFTSSVSSSPEWGASTSSPVQFCIRGCDLLLKGSVLFMSWKMTGKAPYLLAQLCLIPCFPLPIGILSICLCCTQLFLPSHLERQCCGDHILFKFIFRNTATWFSIRLLKHSLHLYLTWDNLQVPTMCQKKAKKEMRLYPSSLLSLTCLWTCQERESLNLL